ncbi:MAG: site-2 protease family protein, partial [Oscillospiraceae bacterium]|nr:site-2 protease family protein [Oscillospiraceae bacterium]
MSFLVALLALCVIILIHEIGHFSAAKLFDMKVYAFNLGMGPTLFKKRGKETVYAVKLLPIGGSVLLGEDEEQGDDPREFRNRPVWQRMIVIVAGAVFNLILGLVLCVIISATGEGFATLTVGAFGQGAVSNTG